MKRSRAVAALLLGGVSPIMVACCEDSPGTATVYPSVEACAAEMAAKDCAAAFATASKKHNAKAPRFASQEACEAEMGDLACVSANESRESSVSHGFVPALVGFMIGRSLTGIHPQPVYFDRQGYARSGNAQIGRAPVPPPRQDEAESGSGQASSGSGSYYQRDQSNAGKALTVTMAGRNAGFGATGSSRCSSGG